VRATCSALIILLDLLTTVVPLEKYKSYRHLSLDLHHIKDIPLLCVCPELSIDCSFLQCDNRLVERNVFPPTSLWLWHVFLYSEILYATWLTFMNPCIVIQLWK
jgi:hypothetical protein